MKLNIGASNPRGQYRGPEWINIDYSRHFRGMGRPRFVLADGTMLPFRDSIFDEIHAVHVLEHVPRHVTRKDGTKVDAHLAFVSEIGRVLTPGGVGFIEVPDFLAGLVLILVRAQRVAKSPNPHDCVADLEEIRIRTVGVYGKGRHEGDLHRWGFTPWGLESLFKSAQLAYSRESEMISAHYRQEPILLYRVWRTSDHRSR